EVAKAVGCKVEDVDKEFVLGILIHFQNVGAEDKARLKLKGKIFLESVVGRKK
ncbi:TPA: conjugal transfer protein TraD, partial [Escherichia coli]